MIRLRTPDHDASDGEQSVSSSQPWRWLLLVGTPIALGGVLAVHPHGGTDLYESLAPVADVWLYVHLLLLPLFALLGVSLYLLLADFAGPVATAGRIGVAVYLVTYLAFEAIAGIATGLLVRVGQGLPAEQQAGVAAALEATVTSPVVGALALVGSLAITVAAVALGILLRRAGAPLVPVALLAGVPLVVVAHGGGYADVLGAAMIAISVGWLEFGWRDGRRSSSGHAV
ncbi:hypothetical protein [Salinadaptatus halalkaliphilus]|uniref:hypothetical protein n=1 Tax=Salinadaptatus halalkaliphilus TaxID=2419781 RepID=UPI001580102C|nr:hypothetical protein [Salinadaptatus halalkaliphilus]